MTKRPREHAVTKGTVSRRAFLKTGGLLGLASATSALGANVAGA